MTIDYCELLFRPSSWLIMGVSVQLLTLEPNVLFGVSKTCKQ